MSRKFAGRGPRARCLLVAALAAVLQIGRFTEFIVGDACDGINKVLREISNLGGDGLDPLRLNGDDVCFDVDTRMESGALDVGMRGGATVKEQAEPVVEEEV